MRPALKRRAAVLLQRGIAQGFASDTPAQDASPPRPPGVAPNRHSRRAQAVFNRRFAKRMKKEKLPVTIEVLPDGGIHVRVDGKQEPEGEEKT